MMMTTTTTTATTSTTEWKNRLLNIHKISALVLYFFFRFALEFSRVALVSCFFLCLAHTHSFIRSLSFLMLMCVCVRTESTVDRVQRQWWTLALFQHNKKTNQDKQIKKTHERDEKQEKENKRVCVSVHDASIFREPMREQTKKSRNADPSEMKVRRKYSSSSNTELQLKM